MSGANNPSQSLRTKAQDAKIQFQQIRSDCRARQKSTASQTNEAGDCVGWRRSKRCKRKMEMGVERREERVKVRKAKRMGVASSNNGYEGNTTVERS